MWQVHVALATGACLLWAIACVSFGAGILQMLRGGPVPAGVLGLSFALGAGAFASVGHFMILLHIFTVPWVAAFLGLGSLFGLWRTWPARAAILENLRAPFFESMRLPWPWRLVVVLLIVLLSYLWLATLSAPGTDAMAYYLAQAKLISATGRLTTVPTYEAFAHLGLFDELNYASVISLGGMVGAKMSFFIVAIACAGILWAICARLGLGTIGRWAALVMLFTSTAFTFVIWDGKTDLYPTMFAMAAIFSIICIDNAPRRMSVLGGFLSAIAIMTKPSLLVVLPPIILALVIAQLCPGRSMPVRITALQALVGFIIGGLIGVIPVVLKNVIEFGEPLAPFLYFHSATNLLGQSWFSPENTRHIILTYPLALTFGSYPMQHGNLSPLVLAFAPLLLLNVILGWRRCDNYAWRLLVALTVGATLGLLAWLIVRPSVLAPRYILPALLGFIPIMAFAVDDLWRRSSWRGLKIATVVACASFLVTATHALDKHVWKDLAYVRKGPDAYRHPIWRSVSLVNSSAKPGARVDLEMWYRSMLRVDLMQCLLTIDELGAALAADEPWSALHDFGVRYVILDRLTHGEQFKLSHATLPSWLSVSEISIKERWSVFRLKPSPEAPPSRKQCREIQPNVWEVVETNPH